jgi:hypothetical protein
MDVHRGVRGELLRAALSSNALSRYNYWLAGA